MLLEYPGENHGLAKENRKDYTVRMKEFFYHYLMGKALPVVPGRRAAPQDGRSS